MQTDAPLLDNQKHAQLEVEAWVETWDPGKEFVTACLWERLWNTKFRGNKSKIGFFAILSLNREPQN